MQVCVWQALFWLWLGDHWSIKSLRLVFLVGMGLSLLPAIVLCFFDSNRALGDCSEAVAAAEQHNQPLLSTSTVKQHESRFMSVPGSIVLSDMIGSIASGMTVKFFAIFFFL